MDNGNLRKLQLLQTKCLLEVKRICEKHNIQYFLFCGTLLGAARHQGFIPWDDDIDIGMLRSDYQHFIKVCETELSPDFFLQTKESDENYALPFAKLRLRGTRRIEKSSASTNIDTGIDIDIVPHDAVSANPSIVWLHGMFCWMLRSMYAYKCGYQLVNEKTPGIKKIAAMFCIFSSFFITKTTLSHLMDKVYQINNNKNTIYVASLSEMRPKDAVMKLVEVMNQVFLPFEGVEHPVPACYHEYLSNYYGADYMEMPPEEKRRQHDIIELDFGAYE